MLRDITQRLDDHHPGEKLLHEASAEIKALRSKLGDAETARTGFEKLAAARWDEIKDLTSRLDGYVKQYNAAQDDSARAIKELQSRLNSAAKAWEGVKCRLALQPGADAQQRGMFWDDCSDLNHALLDLVDAPAAEKCDHLWVTDGIHETACSKCGQPSVVERGTTNPSIAAALEVAKREPIEPDADGDCKRCGLRWDEEELSGAVKHECPPGFLSE